MTALSSTLRRSNRTSPLLVCVLLIGVASSVFVRGDEPQGPLLAYVGTFSSPLSDVLPTQVDRPPGNGRGIHQFEINRKTGAMTAAFFGYGKLV